MVLYLTEINSSLKWLLLYSLSLLYFMISSKGKFRNGEKYQSKTISKIKNYNRDQYSKTYCSYIHLIQDEECRICIVGDHTWDPRNEIEKAEQYFFSWESERVKRILKPKEMKQLHWRNSYVPKHYHTLTKKQKDQLLESHIFVEEKCPDARERQ